MHRLNKHKKTPNPNKKATTKKNPKPSELFEMTRSKPRQRSHEKNSSFVLEILLRLISC